MINDGRVFSLEDSYKLWIDGVETSTGDLQEYIKSYIRDYDIAPVGCSIVYHNAMTDGPKPSGYGTMYNLYTLFKLLKYHRALS